MLETWLYGPVKSLLQTANARTGNQDRFASHHVVLHVRINPPAQVGFLSLQRQSGAGELCSLDSRNNVSRLKCILSLVCQAMSERC